jgi:hypothetical protein
VRAPQLVQPRTSALHYEQRRGGVVQRVVLNGVRITYYGNTTITSSTGC